MTDSEPSAAFHALTCVPIRYGKVKYTQKMIMSSGVARTASISVTAAWRTPAGPYTRSTRQRKRHHDADADGHHREQP